MKILTIIIPKHISLRKIRRRTKAFFKLKWSQSANIVRDTNHQFYLYTEPCRLYLQIAEANNECIDVLSKYLSELFCGEYIGVYKRDVHLIEKLDLKNVRIIEV